MTAIAIPIASDPRRVCVIAGQGLLGSRITHYLKRLASAAEQLSVDFEWGDQKAVLESLLYLTQHYSAESVDLVWSAGSAGFSASDKDMEIEHNLFRHVVDNYVSKYGDKLVINLISSAGGIHEGCGIVTSKTDVCPLRPYGEWKLKQEEYLSSIGALARIFRVSSAFGIGLVQQRKGLISALIQSAYSASTVNVHAKPNTLRDYIYVDDVALHVTRRILGRLGMGVEVVASGRPTSIDALTRLIQTIVRHPVKVSFRATSENDLNVVFHRRVISDISRVTPLEESLRLLVLRLALFPEFS